MVRKKVAVLWGGALRDEPKNGCEGDYMFRYELVNSTRKFTIVAEIVSLLKNIYKRDAPFRAMFKVKTLAVLFSAYPCEINTYREI